MDKNILKDEVPKPSDNDVFSPKFESKMDSYFTMKEKEKDAWSRRSYNKIYGQWT